MENTCQKRNDLKLSFCSEDLTIYGGSIDELIDQLESLTDVILECGKFINEFIEKFNLSSEQYSRLDKLILNTNDSKQFLRYVVNRIAQARRSGSSIDNLDEFEDKLIKIADSKSIIRFLLLIPNVNVRKFEDAFCNGDFILKNTNQRVTFFLIEGMDLNRIKKMAFESKNSELIYEICMCLQDKNLLSQEDVSLAEDIIIESKDYIIIWKFAKNIAKANIEKLQDGFIKAKPDQSMIVFNFALIEGADAEKLRPIMLQTTDEFRWFWINSFEEKFGKFPPKKNSSKEKGFFNPFRRIFLNK